MPALESWLCLLAGPLTIFLCSEASISFIVSNKKMIITILRWTPTWSCVMRKTGNHLQLGSTMVHSVAFLHTCSCCSTTLSPHNSWKHMEPQIRSWPSPASGQVASMLHSARGGQELVPGRVCWGQFKEPQLWVVPFTLLCSFTPQHKVQDEGLRSGLVRTGPGSLVKASH